MYTRLPKQQIMKNKKTPLAIGLLIVAISYFSSCRKDKAPVGIDGDLFGMAQKTSGFTWYKNSAALLDKSSGSGHPQAFLRTRYNSVAATMLDSSGVIKDSIQFPEGSLIVKELYKDASTLSRYAVLYKNSSHEDADTKGWVWGYINADGSIAETAINKGKACINCHSQPGNIDYMLMNSFFP